MARNRILVADRATYAMVGPSRVARRDTGETMSYAAYLKESGYAVGLYGGRGDPRGQRLLEAYRKKQGTGRGAQAAIQALIDAGKDQKKKDRALFMFYGPEDWDDYELYLGGAAG